MPYSSHEAEEPVVIGPPIHMRILLASSSSGSRGGGEIYLLYLGRELAAMGHEVSLWAARHARMDELCAKFEATGKVIREDYTNTYDRRTRTLGAALDSATARRVAAGWRALDPDILHLNKQNLEDGAELLRAARLSARPCVCTIHLTQSARWLGARCARLRDMLSRRMLRRFPGEFIAVSDSRAADLTALLGGGGRVHALPNGVPVPTDGDLAARRAARREALGLSDADPLIVGVGRLMPQKRPEVFLDQAAVAAAAHPAVRILWVGGGHRDPLWDGWVAARGLSGRVTRIPWSDDVPSLLAAADVFLHTAAYEGLPLALLEAMAAGLPCVLTPNLAEDLPNIERSTYLTTDSPEWPRLLGDAGRRRALGQAARALVAGHHSTRLMAGRTVEVHRRAIRGMADTIR